MWGLLKSRDLAYIQTPAATAAAEVAAVTAAHM